MTIQSSQLATLAARYVRFAAECDGISPLYAFLAAQIAQDQTLLTMALVCRPEQPSGNLFLGAVHYLLLQMPDHPLAAYYPSLTPTPLPVAEAFPTFKAFCLDHRFALEEILATHLVQTNEIRRCSYLLPAFAHIAQRTNHQGIAEPLAILELGASAGLNLLWDHYDYQYQHQESGVIQEAGASDSPVLLRCTIRGESFPALPATLPPVAWRMGLDLNPLDLRNDQHYRWLQALIWPEHGDRVALLADAHLLYQRHPPTLRRGDLATDLTAALAEMPAYATPVIFHTHVFNQVGNEAREQVTQQLATFAGDRPLYRLGNDLMPPALQHFPLTLQIYENGQMTADHLADVDGHGRWLQWHR